MILRVAMIGENEVRMEREGFRAEARITKRSPVSIKLPRGINLALVRLMMRRGSDTRTAYGVTEDRVCVVILRIRVTL